MVTLAVYSGELSANAKVVINAARAEVSVSEVELGTGGFIEINNASPFDIDISGWHIAAGMQTFSLPLGTIVAKGQRVKFGASVTALNVEQNERVLLMYPGGSIAHEYNWTGSQPIAGSAPVSPTEPAADENNTDTGILAPTASVSVRATAPKIHISSKSNSAAPSAGRTVSIENNGAFESVDENLGEDAPFDVEGPQTEHTAASLEAGDMSRAQSSSIAIWLIASIAITGVGAASAVVMRRQFGGHLLEAPKASGKIEGYEIIED
jgi:hypothetical protein